MEKTKYNPLMRLDPVRHWVFDGWLSFSEVENIRQQLPHLSDPQWVKYDNPLERKYAYNASSEFGPEVQQLYRRLSSPTWLQYLEQLTGIAGLFCDPLLHGAGIHCYPPGGFLQTHVDYAIHPKIPCAERRVNVILFLVDLIWAPEWGGRLRFHDLMGEQVVAQYAPEPGRLVLWEASDMAYHSCEHVLGPRNRYTAAMYYLAPARPQASRRRALFVPIRG